MYAKKKIRRNLLPLVLTFAVATIPAAADDEDEPEYGEAVIGYPCRLINQLAACYEATPGGRFGHCICAWDARQGRNVWRVLRWN
jgi:hypothetical protein